MILPFKSHRAPKPCVGEKGWALGNDASSIGAAHGVSAGEEAQAQGAKVYRPAERTRVALGGCRRVRIETPGLGLGVWSGHR